MFSPKGMELERGWPGRIDGRPIVQLAAQTLQAFFTGGGGAREHATYPLGDCDLRAPVLYPPAVRVFGPPSGSSSRRSSSSAARSRCSARRTCSPIRRAPADLVLGPAIAAVIGADGASAASRSPTSGRPATWPRPSGRPGSAPRRAATSASRSAPSSLPPTRRSTVSPGARVDGREQAVGGLAEALAAWPGLVAHAALNTTLRPGDILVVALPAGEQPPLARGSVVELEAGGHRRAPRTDRLMGRRLLDARARLGRHLHRRRLARRGRAGLRRPVVWDARRSDSLRRVA